MTTKKPLFNRPAWASSGITAISNSVEEPIFGRQNIYEDLLKAGRAKKEQKARKSKGKAEDKNAEHHKSKKRRTSDENDDLGYSSTSSSEVKPHKRSKTPDLSESRAVTRNTLRKERLSKGLEEPPSNRKGPRESARQATVVTLVDTDSDDEIPRIEAASMPKLKTSPLKPKGRDDELLDSEEEDDPYLQELKQRAREKKRMQLQLPAGDAEKPKPPPSPLVEFDTPSLSDKLAQSATPFSPADSQSPQPTATAVDDPQVEIYIKPLIPNTKPLIVSRKASQPLEQVRFVWCQKQNLPAAEANKIFFTWRQDLKLFDSSTMRHIVERMKKEHKSTEDPSNGRIYLEAVTQEIFEKIQQEKARRLAAELGDAEEEAEEDVLAPPAEPDKSNKFIIRFRSKEYGEMPIRIRPETTVMKMTEGFKHQKSPDATKTCYLIFDGDRLEPEQTAEEVGLEDGDVVEVQFR